MTKNKKLDGKELELHLRDKYGDDYESKTKPSEEELNENYSALLWCIISGEESKVVDYIDERGSRRKKLVGGEGASIDDALTEFGLRPYVPNK